MQNVITVNIRIRLNRWCQEFCVNELVTALGTPTGLEPEIEFKDRLVRRGKFNFKLIYNNISENKFFKIK